MVRGFALLTLGLCIGIACQKYTPLELPDYSLHGVVHIGPDIPADRVIHRSYHEYTLPPNACGITVQIMSEGAGGGPDPKDSTFDTQRCLTVKGEKGINGGGDGGDAIFCGDSVAILPGHGGDGGGAGGSTATYKPDEPAKNP